MTKEVVLLEFAVGSKSLVLSKWEMDYRGYEPFKGRNIVWQAPPRGDLRGLPKHEFVIRNDNGVVKVIRRERDNKDD